MELTPHEPNKYEGLKSVLQTQLSSFPLEVQSSNQKGRYIVCNAPLRKDQLVFRVFQVKIEMLN